MTKRIGLDAAFLFARAFEQVARDEGRGDDVERYTTNFAGTIDHLDTWGVRKWTRAPGETTWTMHGEFMKLERLFDA